MSRRPARSWHGVQASRLVVSVCLALVLALALVVLVTKGKSYASFGRPELKWNSFSSSIRFNPSVEIVNGTDVIWQIPDSPKAVLFLAHGCNGKAENFWDRSETCPNCVGLPEERLIALNALSRNFAILTISSAGRCWTFGQEEETAKRIIRWWIVENSLQNLPVTALGASSGGYFVSALATKMRFSSITLMIAEGVFEAMDIPVDYPPSLFVHMPKDRRRSKLIVENMEVLRQKGIKVAEIKCKEFPLTRSFFSDRIAGLDQTVSVKLFELFQRKGFIDSNGYMRADGRATNWKEALRGGGRLSLKPELTNHIQEEMNLAYAYHEMTSLQMEQILDWFELHMG